MASSRELLEKKFDLRVLNDPRDDTPELLADVEVLFAPLGFKLSSEKMSMCPNLKAIASNTTGVPHIDVGEANSRGIFVAALHDDQAFLDTITPTAELTIGLMLAAWRRIPSCHVAAASGAWDRREWGAPRMFSRMRLGIVGYGRLGRQVGRIATAMGMEIDFFDPYVSGGRSSLIDLARRSDILSIHAVASAETVGLVSRAVLETLPKGAMVVNTARGELLDTDALLDLLESRHLFAAALDAIDGEYEPEFQELFGNSRVAKYARCHDNLILTPHIGGSTHDAWSATEVRVINKLVQYFDVPLV